MRRAPRPGVVVTAVSVAVSFLTVCVPGTGSAHASTAAAADSGNSSWAYGTVRTTASSGQGGAYAYTATSTAGFAVVLNETPTTPGNYTLDVHRTMGLVLSVEYCRPNCRVPAETATVGFHAWETLQADLGLTTDATLTVNGTQLPAIGLSSSALTAVAGLHLTSVVRLAGSLYSSRNASAVLQTATTTTFSPALGLLPSTVTNDVAGTLTNGEEWSSSSNFSETGNATWAISDVRTGPLPRNFSREGEFGLNSSGVISLGGSDPGTTVTLGGLKLGVLNLTVSTGPFALREGFLLVPEGSNLFGGGLPGWVTSNTNDTGSVSVSQANIDIARGSLTSGDHLGFEASGMWWDSATDNPATEAAAVPGVFAPAVEPASASNATYLQGSPESVGQATSDQKCLATALGCPSAAGPRGFLGLLLLGGAAAVIVVLLMVVLVERRRLPPPKYPNATLYPPGSSEGGAPIPRRPPTRPTGQAEDDPLGHLW